VTRPEFVWAFRKSRSIKQEAAASPSAVFGTSAWGKFAAGITAMQRVEKKYPDLVRIGAASA
jgi:hypothetical protein